MRSSKDQDKFVIRLPDGLRDRIFDQAVANHRSMNSEIVRILKAGLGGSDGLGEAARELIDAVRAELAGKHP